MFGLYISSLLISSTTVSYLSSSFVIAELFCGTGLQQYSSKFEYRQTFITHHIPEEVSKEMKECLIRIDDGINIFTKRLTIE